MKSAMDSHLRKVRSFSLLHAVGRAGRRAFVPACMQTRRCRGRTHSSASPTRKSTLMPSWKRQSHTRSVSCSRPATSQVWLGSARLGSDRLGVQGAVARAAPRAAVC
jgi:hypothetical protein